MKDYVERGRLHTPLGFGISIYGLNSGNVTFTVAVNRKLSERIAGELALLSALLTARSQSTKLIERANHRQDHSLPTTVRTLREKASE